MRHEMCMMYKFCLKDPKNTTSFMIPTKPLPALLIQVYGKLSLWEQSIYAILSYLHHNSAAANQTTLVLYTDCADKFKPFQEPFKNVIIEHLDSDRLGSWCGKKQFVHRVKVEILRHFLRHYQQDVLYLDTDVYFSRAVPELHSLITPTQSLMHIKEDTLAKPAGALTRKIARFVRSKAFTNRHPSVHIPQETAMWNAGVLGISAQNVPLLDDVLALTDILYEAYPKHVMEQLAFSYYLQNATQVVPAAGFIQHYWREKAQFQPHLSDFLAHNNDLDRALKHFGSLPKPESYPPLPKRRFWHKWLGLRT